MRRGRKISIRCITLWKVLSCLDPPNGKLDPPSVDCALHQLNKINYQISHPNIRAKRICIEEFLNYVEHGATRIILVLKTNCLSSY